mgnify:CR=1 FL=1
MDDEMIIGKAGKELQKQMQSIKALSASFRPPEYNIAHLTSPHSINPAQWTHERLAKYIVEFEAELDKDHEIGARLVSFGQNIAFHIDDIGYHGPDIVTFYGTDENGQRVQLIQNIAQLSVLLVAMKKVGEKANRIGFKLLNSESEDDSHDDGNEKEI